jgi:hypothetical protein
VGAEKRARTGRKLMIGRGLMEERKLRIEWGQRIRGGCE